jgi:hypothetical protein
LINFADYGSIGKGTLKITSKLLNAKCYGIPIVDENWITECAKTKEEVDHKLFLADGEASKNKLPSNWSHGVATPKIFNGKAVYLTQVLKKVYGTKYLEMSELIKSLGATKTVSINVAGVEKDHDVVGDMIVVGAGNDDKDAILLAEKEFPVYNKELISWSILRGALDLNSDEFRLAGEALTKSSAKASATKKVGQGARK